MVSLRIPIFILSCLSFDLVSTGARANPISINFSSSNDTANAHLIRRVIPDFDPNDNWKKDPKKVDIIKQGYHDALTLAARGYYYALYGNGDIMDKYFKKGDGPVVKNVLKEFLGQVDDRNPMSEIWTGSSHFDTVFFVNKPWKEDHVACGKYAPDLAALPMSFTTDVGNGRMNVHLCDEGLSYPLLPDMSCNTGSDNTNGMMSSLGGLILNALLHHNPAFEQIVGGGGIGNQLQDCPPSTAWGPYTSENRASDKCPNGRPLYNVDNYRWYVQEVEFSWSCHGMTPYGPAIDNRDRWAMEGHCRKDQGCHPI